MAKSKFNMVVVAHPDDESIFFGGLIQCHRRHPWRVVVATDGNANGNGLQRIRDLKMACKKLGVKSVEVLGHTDDYGTRLNIETIASQLREWNAQEIYTHSIIGDYGHPHHQDVAMAATKAYSKGKLFYLAYNCQADRVVKLSDRAFRRRSEILSTIYFSETKRFQNFLAARSSDEFARVSDQEVEHIYNVCINKENLDVSRLKKYKWYAPFLREFTRLTEPI